MIMRFGNVGVGQLGQSITTIENTLLLLDGQGTQFPAVATGQYAVAVLQAAGVWEVVHISAVAGDILSVVRGREGTTARNFPAGTTVELRVTAGLLDGFQQRAVPYAAPSGTQAAPTIGFAGDMDSGFYHHGDDQIALSLAGALRLLFSIDNVLSTAGITVARSNPLFALKKNGSGEANRIFGSTGELSRWILELGDSTAESGESTGSDFVVARFSNNGEPIDIPLRIRRSDGKIIIEDLDSSGTVNTFALTANTFTVNAMEAVSALLTQATVTRLRGTANVVDAIGQNLVANVFTFDDAGLNTGFSSPGDGVISWFNNNVVRGSIAADGTMSVPALLVDGVAPLAPSSAIHAVGMFAVAARRGQTGGTALTYNPGDTNPGSDLVLQGYANPATFPMPGTWRFLARSAPTEAPESNPPVFSWPFVLMQRVA